MLGKSNRTISSLTSANNSYQPRRQARLRSISNFKLNKKSDFGSFSKTVKENSRIYHTLDLLLWRIQKEEGMQTPTTTVQTPLFSQNQLELNDQEDLVPIFNDKENLHKSVFKLFLVQLKNTFTGLAQLLD